MKKNRRKPNFNKRNSDARNKIAKEIADEFEIMKTLPGFNRETYIENCKKMLAENQQKVDETEYHIGLMIRDLAQLVVKEGETAKVKLYRKKLDDKAEELAGWMNWRDRWQQWLTEGETWPTEDAG